VITVLLYAGIGVGCLVVLGLVIWLSNRMLHADEGSTGSIGNAFGSALEVFDPGQGRARDELEAHEKQGAMLPNAKGDDPPVKVDLRSGRVTIRPTQRKDD